MNLRSQKGSSLIEVLVTVLILAIGLLGLAALQSRSMQYNHASALRSQANVLASDIIDRMRVNQTVALAGGYNTAYGTAGPAGASIVATDLRQWKALLSDALPGGDGSVQCAGNNPCTVSVHWTERVQEEDVNNATGFSEFVYTTRL